MGCTLLYTSNQCIPFINLAALKEPDLVQLNSVTKMIRLVQGHLIDHDGIPYFAMFGMLDYGL